MEPELVPWWFPLEDPPECPPDEPLDEALVFDVDPPDVCLVADERGFRGVSTAASWALCVSAVGLAAEIVPGTVARPTVPDAELEVPASKPETSSLVIAPELTATVPRPTPVVAVIPSRRNVPCMFMLSVSPVSEDQTTTFGKETSKVSMSLVHGRADSTLSWHSRNMTILLVEDDRAIADALVDGLRDNGYAVTHVVSGKEAIEKVRGGGITAVILDLGLPDIDGTEVCRQIRVFSHVPIIVASARETEMDRVNVLDMGADDYVVKPFGIKELVARIQAVVRRATGTVAPITHIEVGSLVIDSKARTVMLGGVSVSLTPKEFDLLEYLAREPGTVFRRTDILRDVWKTTWYGTTKTLDAHVASIRKKLGNPEWVESVRGVGFTVKELP